MIAHRTGRGNRRGSAFVEAAIFLPFTALLLFGLVEFSRLAYTYFVIQKIIYAVAAGVSTRQAVNFCDGGDPSVLAAKNWALTGTEDGSADKLVGDLTTDMIQVRVEKYNTDTQELLECACEASGCDAQQGAVGPDYIVVSIPDGYPVQLKIPFMALLDPILLHPEIRLPYRGT
jgi:hypothetical protein